MPYISLYRKYRSQTFEDVIGQDHVVRTLKNAIKTGRIGHGYLFCGSRGTGKTSVARLIAKALNCINGPAPEPCNVCEACISITNGTAVDVIEVDAASNRGIDDIREITDNVRYAPMRLRYKVYIIDEAHQVTSAAKDAFLKTLEEPPPHAVFILATTESGKIPLTIRSRCQQFDFRRGSAEEIGGRLKHVIGSEGISADDDAIELVARCANGSYRDSLSMLEQLMAYTNGAISAKDVYSVLGMLDEDALLGLGEVIAGSDTAAAFQLADRLMREGRDVRELLKSAAGFFRDMLALRVGADKLHANDDRWRNLAELYSHERLIRAIDVFSAAEKELKWSEQHRLGLEMAILKAMARPKEAVRVVDSPVVSQPAPAPVIDVPTPMVKPAPKLPKSVAVDEAEAPTPAETPTETETKDVSLAEVQREWQRILKYAQKVLKKPQVEAVAREGAPSLIDGSVLTIEFPKDRSFHEKRTNEYSETIHRAVLEVLGADLKIRTALSAQAPVEQPAKVSSANKPKPEPEQHPLINDVVTMFDGTLVQDENDPWEGDK